MLTGFSTGGAGAETCLKQEPRPEGQDHTRAALLAQRQKVKGEELGRGRRTGTGAVTGSAGSRHSRHSQKGLLAKRNHPLREQ